MQRIAKTEHELATVTTEFTEGFEARFGPLPCLHEAQEAMEAAAAALDQKNAMTGRDQEGTALAGLATSIGLMIVALFATSRVVHVSIATGMMGMMLVIYAVPVLSLALVAWAVASRRLSDGARRASTATTTAWLP